MKITWPLLYIRLVLCTESEEHLEVMVERFVDVCRRRRLRVSTEKIKGIVLVGDVVLESKIRVDSTRFGQVSEF